MLIVQFFSILFLSNNDQVLSYENYACEYHGETIQNFDLCNTVNEC